MKITTFFSILFLLGFGCVFSQDKIQFQKQLTTAQTALENNAIEEAILASKTSLSHAFLLNDHDLKSKSYHAIGLCFAKLKENKKAIAFFEKGINEAVLTNNDSIKGLLYCNLAIALENSDPEKANDYQKKASFFFKKITNFDAEATAIIIQNKKSAATKSVSVKKIDLITFEKEIEAIEIGVKEPEVAFKDSKTVDILLATIIGVLLLLVFSLLRNNKQRDKSNKILEKNNAELLLAKDKAEKATQLKSQFVSSITHELRTPLYGVVGITDIIIDEHKELATSPHINSLRFSATYLLSLVNDLLQINKIEERKIVLDKNIINLREELTTIANSMQFIALKNNNKVVISIDQAIPLSVISDKLRLSQVFINLISNALKFTKNGQVTLSANLEREYEKYHYISFEVKDTGIGIAKADQEEIFEKFVQLERNEDDYQGTGLGLSIVKNLIEIFGGKISLESQEGKGTTFFFTIPFSRYDEIESKITTKSSVTSENTNYHVLVVEDNKINQIVTRKILEKNNFNCTVIDNGNEAISILNSEKIDIILMDINMPIINGYETAKLIRQHNFTTPIIALTAFDKEEIADKAYAAGMNDIIVKPFDKEKLFQIITEVIVPKK